MGGSQSSTVPSNRKVEIDVDKNVSQFILDKQHDEILKELTAYGSFNNIDVVNGKVYFDFNEDSFTSADECKNKLQDFVGQFSSFEEPLSTTLNYDAVVKNLTDENPDSAIQLMRHSVRITGLKSNVQTIVRQIRRYQEPQPNDVPEPATPQSNQASTSISSNDNGNVKPQQDLTHKAQPVTKPPANVADVQNKEQEEFIPATAFNMAAIDPAIARFVKFSYEHIGMFRLALQKFCSDVSIQQDDEKKWIYVFHPTWGMQDKNFKKSCAEALTTFLSDYSSVMKRFNKERISKARELNYSFFNDQTKAENRKLFVRWFLEDSKVQVVGTKQDVETKVTEILDYLEDLVPRTFKHKFSINVDSQILGRFLLLSRKHPSLLWNNFAELSKVLVEEQKTGIIVKFTSVIQMTKNDVPHFEYQCTEKFERFLSNYTFFDCSDREFMELVPIARKEAQALFMGSEDVFVKLTDDVLQISGLRTQVEERSEAVTKLLQELKTRKVQRKLEIPIMEEAVGFFLLKSSEHRARLQNVSTVATASLRKARGKPIVEFESNDLLRQDETMEFEVECQSLLASFLEGYLSWEHSYPMELIRSARKEFHTVFANAKDVVVMTRNDAVSIAGVKEKVEMKVTAVEGIMASVTSRSSSNALQRQRHARNRIVRDLSQAEKDRNNFIFDCNEQETCVLDYALGSRHQMELVNIFQNIGPVYADPVTGKVLVELHRRVPKFKDHCLSLFKEFFSHFTVANDRFKPTAVMAADNLNSQLFREKGNQDVVAWFDGGTGEVTVVGLKGKVEEKLEEIRSQVNGPQRQRHVRNSIVCDLSQAKKDRNNFIFDCNEQEACVLDYALGSRHQMELVNIFQNIGPVYADPVTGKVLVELHRRVPKFKDHCLSLFKEFFSHFTVANDRFKPTAVMAADNLNNQLFREKGNQDVVAWFDGGTGDVTVVGLKGKVEEKLEEIRSQVGQLSNLQQGQPIESVQRPRVLQEKPCSKDVAKVLMNCGVIEEVNAKHRGKVAITWDLDREITKYDGSAEDIAAAVKEIENFSLIERTPDVTEPKMNYMNKVLSHDGCDRVRSVLDEELVNNSCKAALVFRDGGCVVVERDEEAFQTSCHILSEVITVDEVQLASAPCFIEEKAWQDLVEKSFKEKMVVVREKDGQINVTGIEKQAIKEIADQVKSLSEDYVTETLTFASDKEKSRFIATRWSMRSELPASVKLSMVNRMIQVVGPKVLAHEALSFITEKSKEIKLGQVDCTKPGVKKYVQGQKWKAFKAVFEEQHGCALHIRKAVSPDSSGDSAHREFIAHHQDRDPADVSSHEEVECKYDDVTVKIAKGDITVDDSEAIVNGCSNEFNLNWGSVSAAVLRRAGPQMQIQCSNNPVRKSTHLRVTNGWNLLCQYVIHVVTPRNIDELSSQIKEALDEAELLGVRSVALPTLGAGGIGLDAEKVAASMRHAFQLFAYESPVRVKTIKVVVYDSSLVSIFQRNIISSQLMLGIGKRELELAKAKYQKEFSSEKLFCKFYCNDSDQLEKVRKLLPSCIDEAFDVKCIRDDMFEKFDDNDWIDVHLSAIKHGATFTYTAEPPTIKLEGLKENVLELHQRIKDICSEFQVAHVLLKICTWKWSTGHNSFSILPARVCKEIENSYESGNQPSVDLTLYGESFVVNVRERTYRYGNCDGSIKRFDHKGEKLPSDWDDMLDKSWRKVNLSTNSHDYKRIEKRFRESNPRFSSIVQIERIQNPKLYKQYMDEKKDVEHHLTSSNPVERELFHGTSVTDAEKICELGFNRSFCGKNATVYGQGVYFAVNSSYSANYAPKDIFGMQKMFVAKVLTGDFCKGNSSFRTPPTKAGAGNRPYDSVVDDETKPAMFVVFKDPCVYPSYLITFQ